MDSDSGIIDPNYEYIDAPKKVDFDNLEEEDHADEWFDQIAHEEDDVYNQEEEPVSARSMSAHVVRYSTRASSRTQKLHSQTLLNSRHPCL